MSQCMYLGDRLDDRRTRPRSVVGCGFRAGSGGSSAFRLSGRVERRREQGACHDGPAEGRSGRYFNRHNQRCSRCRSQGWSYSARCGQHGRSEQDRHQFHLDSGLWIPRDVHASWVCHGRGGPLPCQECQPHLYDEFLCVWLWASSLLVDRIRYTNGWCGGERKPGRSPTALPRTHHYVVWEDMGPVRWFRNVLVRPYL